MGNELTRRGALAALAAGAAVAMTSRSAFALDTASARALVGRLVADINRIINSGESEQQMFKDFEGVFTKYSDVATIARATLGIAARQATPAQMQAYTEAFKGYISRKYGRRFREFIGGSIEVVSAQKVNGFYSVDSVAKLRGQAPFSVRWDVSDRSGRDLFFNIIIEGINMLAAERSEIGAMLDKSHGNIDALIQQLKHSG